MTKLTLERVGFLNLLLYYLNVEIQENIPLAPYTTFKVGGAARFFAEAKNEEEIIKAISFAEDKNLPFFILAGGSNVLISDKGFGGLVIKISNFEFQISNLRIECGAGCLLSKIVNESVKNNLTGFEWAAGIPGTIGGAVRGNAGALGHNMANVVESVKVLRIRNSKFEIRNKFKIQNSNNQNKSQLQITNYKLQDCQFSYRDSVFKQNNNLIILSVALKLQEGDMEKSRQVVKDILKKRKQKQPLNFPSAGSFFRNPAVKDKKLIKEFERDTRQKIIGDKIPAGYLIEALGLKGKKIGGAMVSQSHGNFIVNAGNAKAEDVVILASLIKQKVRNRFGIQLLEEVQYVGFGES